MVRVGWEIRWGGVRIFEFTFFVERVCSVRFVIEEGSKFGGRE